MVVSAGEVVERPDGLDQQCHSIETWLSDKGLDEYLSQPPRVPVIVGAAHNGPDSMVDARITDYMHSLGVEDSLSAGSVEVLKDQLSLFLRWLEKPWDELTLRDLTDY